MKEMLFTFFLLYLGEGEEVRLRHAAAVGQLHLTYHV